MPPGRSRCSRSPRASPASRPSIKVLAVTPGPVRSFVRRRDAGARPKAVGRDHHADRGRRRGGAAGGDVREDAGLRARDGKARRPRRQRLLRRLHPGRSRPARWPPRHHALAAHPAFCQGLSEDEAGARPHLRPRRQHLELGRDQRRHRPGAGDGRRRISATRSRSRPRASSCSTTAAAAASRNSPRCWN